MALAKSSVAVLRFFGGGVDQLGRTHSEMLAFSFDRMEECHDWIQTAFPLHEESAFALVFPVLTKPHAAALASSPEAVARMRAMLSRMALFYGLDLAHAPSSFAVDSAGALPGLAGAAAAAAASADGARSPGMEVGAAAAGSALEQDEGRAAAVGGVDAAGAAEAAAASSAAASAGDAAAGVPAAAPDASAAAVHADAVAGAGADAPPPAAVAADPSRISLWAHPGDHNLLRVTRIVRSLRLFGLDAESAAFYAAVRAVGEARGLSAETLEYWRRSREEPMWAPLRRTFSWGGNGGGGGGGGGDDGADAGRTTRSGKRF